PTSSPGCSSTRASAFGGQGSRRRSASRSARTGSPASGRQAPGIPERLDLGASAWERGRPPRRSQVRPLSNYYAARAAIRSLSFRMESGEVVGFLGLNGAGKTTTLRILGGALLPPSGPVRLDGQALATAPRALRAKVGFLPETPPLYEEMTVGE